MKDIYVSHTRDYDFKKQLYEPLRESGLNYKFNIILPHEKSDTPYNSKDLFKSRNFQCLLAEISYPSISLGIELGWADSCGIKIICLVKKGFKISNSLRVLTDKFIEYEDSTELIDKLENILQIS